LLLAPSSSSSLRGGRPWDDFDLAGGNAGRDVVGRHDGEGVDQVADFWGQGVEAAVWLFGCSDTGVR
jgi:hypothetical protein